VGPIAVVDFAELRYRMLEEVRPRHSTALAVDEQFVTWHSRAQISCRERDGDQYATIGADPLGTIVSSAGRRAWQVQRGDLGDRFVAVAEGCGPGRDLRADGRLQAMDWPWVYVAGADGLARIDGRTANREVLDPSVRTDSPATVAAELGRAAYISKGRVRLHSPADFHDLGPTPFGADALDQAVALGSRLVVVSGRDTGRTVSRIYDLHAQTSADIDHLATVVGDYLVIERDNDILVIEAS
jgi:hypothetical protein